MVLRPLQFVNGTFNKLARHIANAAVPAVRIQRGFNTSQEIRSKSLSSHKGSRSQRTSLQRVLIFHRHTGYLQIPAFVYDRNWFKARPSVEKSSICQEGILLTVEAG